MDFYDSFTFNIVAELYKQGIHCQVISYHKAFEYFFDSYRTQKKLVLIFGPGPGHPDDYLSDHYSKDGKRVGIYELIKTSLKLNNIYTLGICLGHQLIWRVKGYEIGKSVSPKHGEGVDFVIPPWGDIFKRDSWGNKYRVQRYNSLAVKSAPYHRENDGVVKTRRMGEELYLQEGEVICGKWIAGVSYQFHPESVGTSCPEMFLESTVEFLYNVEA